MTTTTDRALASIDNALAMHETGGVFDDQISEDAMRWEPKPGLPETQRPRRGHDFYPAIAIPALYDTDGQPFADKVIHAHYFVGGSDWWVVEYDPETGEAFGYACLGGPSCAEWGYTSLPELEAINLRGGLLVVERDNHWTAKTVSEAGLPGWRANA